MARYISPTNAACLIALFLTGLVRAEDLVTTDGKVYSRIKIASETPDSIKIMHDGGIAVVPKKVIKPEFLSQHELALAPTTAGDTTAGGDELAATLEQFKANVPSFTTKDGRTFQSKEITKLEPDAVRLMTASGIVKLKFTELKAITQAALNYDPLKAAKYAAEAEKLRQDQAAAALRIANANSEVSSFSSNLRLYLVQNVGKGWLCSADVLEDRDVDVVTSRAGSPLSGPKVIYESRTKTETAKVGEIQRIMIFGLPSFTSMPADMQSRMQWSGKVYRIGNYRLTSASSGNSTSISAAHVDRAEAVRLLAKNGNSVFYSDAGTLKPDEKMTTGSTATGTGFAITSDGYIGTAAHVVKNAGEISVSINGKPTPARVIGVNDSTDVAILKVDGTNIKPLVLAKAATAKLGADLFCVGFPLVGQLGVNPKLTKGALNSLTGLSDDPNSIQMSVQIQPGNSGGPVCNNLGQVIAVVSQTGSTIAGARGAAGAVPQNVNFAAKADQLIDLAATVKDLILPKTTDTSPSPEERALQSCFLITVTTGSDSLGAQGNN